jgi:PTS system beta-glucosides-specific IIC component
MIGGACGGFFMGIFHVKNYTGGSPGLMTMPGYLGGDGFHDLIFAALGAVIAFIIAFIISFIIYRDPKSKKTEQDIQPQVRQSTQMTGSANIQSPINGMAVSLVEVSDPTFSQEILGKGVAIIPSDGRLVSPVKGTVDTVFETLHAIGLKADDGTELLIHIGLDTVKLEGKHFKAFVKAGDLVEVGTLMVEFDKDKIKEEGYDIITPIIITNSMNYGDVLAVTGQEVKVGDGLLRVIC